MPTESTAVDRPPAPAELRAAHAAGLTLVAWRAAGRPRATEPPVPPSTRPAGARSARAEGDSLQRPAARPWWPYRSRLEYEYAKHLEILRATDHVLGWAYEPDRLEIGSGAYYTPDFRVEVRAGRIEYHETKGYKREAAMVRLKAAALRYPEYRFVLVTRKGGQWHFTRIGGT